MSHKELKRSLVLNSVLAGQDSVGQAALLLGVSTRQVYRLIAAYREEGAAGLAHGNRGRKPVNCLSAGVREVILCFSREKYRGFNHQHLTETLREAEGLEVSRSSVRRLLAEAGIFSPRTRRRAKHRVRRERFGQEGALMQIDGSKHRWLGPQLPHLTLIAGIDDATNTIPYALFREQEDAHGYFLLLQGVTRRHGIPLAVYRDGNSIFQSNDRRPESIDEQLKGKRESTQFGRLLRELGVESIRAGSPQAKGRVERLFGTLQDRLSAELMVAGAKTIDEANRVLWQYIDKFNRRFGVEARDPNPAYVQVDAGFDYDTIFCFKYDRVVGADNVVQVGQDRLQLLEDGKRASYAKAKVEVHQRLDGSLVVYHDRKQIHHQPAPLETPKLRLKIKPARGSLPAVTTRARVTFSLNR